MAETISVHVHIATTSIDAHYAAYFADALVKAASNGKIGIDISVNTADIAKTSHLLNYETRSANFVLIVMATDASVSYAGEFRELQSTADMLLGYERTVLIPLGEGIPLSEPKSGYFVIRPSLGEKITSPKDPFLQEAATTTVNRIADIYADAEILEPKDPRNIGNDITSERGLPAEIANIFIEAGVTPSPALTQALLYAAENHSETDEKTGEVLVSVSALFYALFSQGLDTENADHVSWLVQHNRSHPDYDEAASV